MMIKNIRTFVYTDLEPHIFMILPSFSFLICGTAFDTFVTESIGEFFSFSSSDEISSFSLAFEKLFCFSRISLFVTALLLLITAFVFWKQYF